jgi:hypothetical protein
MLNHFFYELKDKYKGQSVAVCGNGPTFNEFDATKKVVTFGCNQHVKCDWIDFDYYFIGDAESPRKGYNNNPELYHDYLINKHPKGNYIRINGYTPNTARCAQVKRDIPTCNYYIADKMFVDEHTMSLNPCESMAVGASIVFDSLQVALYTRPKNLYLVGMDCTLNLGTFVDETTNSTNITDSNNLANIHWMDVKKFITRHYPDINVYCINPVNMRLFEEKTMEEIVENI